MTNNLHRCPCIALVACTGNSFAGHYTAALAMHDIRHQVCWLLTEDNTPAVMHSTVPESFGRCVSWFAVTYVTCICNTLMLCPRFLPWLLNERKHSSCVASWTLPGDSNCTYSAAFSFSCGIHWMYTTAVFSILYSR